MKNAHQAYNSLFVNCVLYPIIFKKPKFKNIYSDKLNLLNVLYLKYIYFSL